MPTIHMTRGIPASGKTTFAKEWVASAPHSRVRVNRDDIRRMTTGTEATILLHELEQHVSTIEKQIALASLHAGRDVIIDAMNLRARYVRPWLSLGYPVVFHDFPVALDAALARNEARGGKVPEQALRDIYLRMTRNGALPDPPETMPPVASYMPDTSLPDAVIFDVDGTLAHMDGMRGPYDWHLVDGDRPDRSVVALAEYIAQARNVTIIIMSGRDESARVLTQQWLDEHSVPWDHLLMRPRGDMRADTIIKRELFDAHVRTNYNVRFVIDDRDSVVRQWRAMGLKCLQAQEGNF